MKDPGNGKTRELKFEVRAHLFQPDVVEERWHVSKTRRMIGIPARLRDWIPTSTVKNDLR